MIFTKTSWFDLIGTDVTKQLINAGIAAFGNINCRGNPAYLKASIKVVTVFGNSPDNTIMVNLYGLDSNVIKTDTTSIWSQKIDPIANFESVITIPNIDTMTIDTIKVEVKNNNSIDPISVWVSYLAAYNQ